MTQPAAQDLETPCLDNAKLRVAIEVAIAKMGITGAQIAREARITEVSMSQLRNHGQAGDRVQNRLVRWLNVRPDLFDPPTPADPPARTEAA